jgi:bifunctional non-homologous end joining protein LigD
MQPLPSARPPVGSGWCHQVKWDGVRMLAFVGADGVRLQNRRLRDRTAHYPELQALRALCRTTAILDGEVICLRDGKPSFPAILRRDLARPERAAALASGLPIHYMVFDIILAGSADLSRQQLADRQRQLSEVLTPSENVVIVEDYPDGELLFAAVAAKELEGIVSKRRDSSYHEGKQVPHWLKTKCRRRIDCVIGGAAYREQRLAALLLGLYISDGRLLYVGRAGSGLTDEQLGLLNRYFRAAGDVPSPFTPPPRLSGVRTVWCRPEMTAVIEYQEWTEQLGLRAPVVAGFGSRPPHECLLT